MTNILYFAWVEKQANKENKRTTSVRNDDQMGMQCIAKYKALSAQKSHKTVATSIISPVHVVK